MPVGDDTYAYRKNLPHLAKRGRTYYVTFCTHDRTILAPRARDIVLRVCTSFHEVLCWLDCIVVMPDHVHLIVTPFESISLAKLLNRVKGRSAREVNHLFCASGAIWQRESFDHILRKDEDLEKKREYIFENPVRKGLCASREEYPWTWWSGLSPATAA